MLIIECNAINDVLPALEECIHNGSIQPAENVNQPNLLIIKDLNLNNLLEGGNEIEAIDNGNAD